MFYRVYIGQRVLRNYQGVSDPVIREPHTIIETLVANIAGGNPKFGYRQTIEEQSAEVDVLTSMADYTSIKNRLSLKVQEWVREALLYGTGIMLLGFKDGWPTITNIALRDTFVDPASTGFVQTINPAKYAGYEFLAYKTDLEKEEVFDAKADKWVTKYSKLDEVGFAETGRSGDEQTAMDKDFKDMFNGSTLGVEAPQKQIHVIVLYDLTSGTETHIGNKKAIIYQAPLWTQREEETRQAETTDANGQPTTTTQKLDAIKPFIPMVSLRDYIDTSQFYGTGEMEVMMQDAELLNDYEAMILDNNAYQNTPMYWIDPAYADMAPEVQTIPGLVLPIPRNAMGVMEIPQLGADLDLKEDRIMARMRRATAADEAVQGVSQSKSRTTATEVQTQLTQAQMRFATKVQNLESEGFAQLGSIIFKIFQIFVTQEQAIRVTGSRGIEFKNFDPYEFNGEYEAYAELESTIKAKRLEVGQKQNQMFEILNAHQGIFDPVELAKFEAKIVDPEMTDDQFDKLLLKQAPPPPDTSKDYLQVNYKDLEPWGRYQAQKDLGWQPDPQLEGDMRLKMANQAVQMNDALNPATDANGQPLPPIAPSQTNGPAGGSPQ